MGGCGYGIHAYCLLRWVESRNTTCPLCRSVVLSSLNLVPLVSPLGTVRLPLAEVLEGPAASQLDASTLAMLRRRAREQDPPFVTMDEPAEDVTDDFDEDGAGNDEDDGSGSEEEGGGTTVEIDDDLGEMDPESPEEDDTSAENGEVATLRVLFRIRTEVSESAGTQIHVIDGGRGFIAS